MRRLCVACLVAVLTLAAAPTASLAYSPSGAAAYADSHWSSCGVPNTYPCISPTDCTAFVSAAMHTGGLYGWEQPTTGVQLYGTSDDHYWYNYYHPIPGNFAYSYSFSTAHDLRQFLIWNYPGGYSRPTMAGTSLALDSGADTGDVLFYDWDSNGRMNHVNIIVGYGTSSDGYYGDYIDGHSNNRYHLYWTTRTYNQDIQTTTIYPMHISASN